MKRKIYILIKSISLFFLVISLKINNHRLSAFIIWLNMRKLKIIKHNNKNIKKILYFSKSGGNHDLLRSFDNHNNKKKNNIIFYWIPRSFIKKIYIYYFKSNYKKDYFTKVTNADEIYKKKQYINRLNSIFSSLDKFIKLDGFISFNIFYYAEKYLDEVCKNLNKKFIILHKESALSPAEEIHFTKGYKKYNEKSLSHKISVYSDSQKKILIKSKIATKNQIVVNGCARSDYAFKLRKVKPQKKIIVFYLIETKRYSVTKFQRVLKITNVNWKKLYEQTLKYLLEYAKNNPDVQLILKGKTGVHKINEINPELLPKNCIYIYGGTGEKLLDEAKVVIAFGSTIVFETIASNRNLIIPNFNLEHQKRKKLVVQIANKKYLINSKKEFYKKLDYYLNSKYLNKKLSYADYKTLKYYIGNYDGMAGKRIRNFLYSIFK